MTTDAQQRMKSSQSLSVKIRRVLWAGVESTLFRFSFHNLYTWRVFVLRCFGAQIGRNCRIRRTVKIYYPWNLRLGDLCIIGDDVSLYSLDVITLGDRVMISQEAYICTGTHDHTLASLPLITKSIVIENDAWICARAFVGPGLVIASGAVVAAAAVVIKDVAAWTIVGGNPAKYIKKREIK